MKRSVSANVLTDEDCCYFIVLGYKALRTIIAVNTEDKVTELFCMADYFCEYFDGMRENTRCNLVAGVTERAS